MLAGTFVHVIFEQRKDSYIRLYEHSYVEENVWNGRWNTQINSYGIFHTEQGSVKGC